MSWPMVKLGSVCKLINGDRGQNYPSKDALFSEGIPFINAGNLQDDLTIKCSGANFISQDRFNLLSNGKVLFGDILFCLRGSLGKFAIVDNQISQGAIASSLVILRPDGKLDRDFLKNYLRSTLCKREIERFENGAAQPNLSAKDLKEFEIPLPPLAEQKRIAAILDEADAIRRKRQQAIQLADDFLRAVFLEMFGDPVTNPKGWEVKPLKDVLKSISSGWSANGDSRPCEEGELGVLKISAVTSGTFIPTENKAVQVSDIPSSKKLVFPKKGDMLFSRANTRELVAASCIVIEDSPNTFLPDKLWLIKTDESQLLPEFLNYLLKTPGFKEKLTSQATGSSGSMLNISMGKFEQTECLVPAIDLQHIFKNLYWKLQETMSCFEQSYSTLQASFNSLSQKAFSGQL